MTAPAARRRTLRIGITGPIGCGKTTVAGWLAARGATVIDADEVARRVSAPGTPVHAAILEAFGPAVTNTDGTLDRAALARLVFSDPVRLVELERLVHPDVRAEIRTATAEAERGGAAVVAIEAIRLTEGGLADLCDEIWLVTCDPAVQRHRLRGRGVEAPDAERRIAAQAGLWGAMRTAATRVIDTSGSEAETEAVVARALGDALGVSR